MFDRRIALFVLATGSLVSTSALAARTERLGDFRIDRATNHVTTLYKQGASYGFQHVKAWFNGEQNGHPAYYGKLPAGVAADRNGILFGDSIPAVGSVVKLHGGTFTDTGVRLPPVKIEAQSFKVMSLDKHDRILIPIEKMGAGTR